MQTVRRNHNVCFTGHRDIRPDEEPVIRNALRRALLAEIQNGADTFISGMAVGFDMLAAEEVLRLQDEGLQIRLVAAIPFHGQESRWKPYLQARYQNLCRRAAFRFVICQGPYRKSFYAQRDQWMVDNSRRVIAFCSASHPNPNSGTALTMRYALRKGVPVLNLAPDTPVEFRFNCQAIA